MSEQAKPEVGSLGWFDLTVPNAEEVKDFYSKVVGWKYEPIPMANNEYHDYNMKAPASGMTVTGICHTRGINSDLPSQWMLYINVKDLDQSVKECKDSGGKIVAGPKDMGKFGKYCVIKDPAGAVCALFEPV